MALHGRQPRASILDSQQRKIALTDPAYRDALRKRVRSADRFAAYMAGTPYFAVPERPCKHCGGMRKRPRDHTCYDCILRTNRTDWQLMQTGISPPAKRSLDGHRDMLARQKRERGGECDRRTWPTHNPPGELAVTRWPTGRTEVLFPDGHREPDFGKLAGQHVQRLCDVLPELRVALAWGGVVVSVEHPHCAA